MCRFLAYSGKSTLMEELLLNSSNSLVEQSRHAKMRFEPVNGDGFGIGWYPLHEDSQPGTFMSIEPAWSNRNLRQIAQKIHTEHFFAHVRDASSGMPVSQSNCHPFQYGNYLWMHNGVLDEFSKTRRRLLAGLSDTGFNLIKGNTDSEHAFALFLDQLEFNKEADGDRMEEALLGTIKRILQLRQDSNANSNAQMNFAVSNGSTSLFCRFASHQNHEAPSLYYSQQDKNCIVASEPLSKEASGNIIWKAVPNNHLLRLEHKGQLNISAITIEQIA